MNLCFLAFDKCAIKINGKYCGLLEHNKFENFSSPPFVEFCSLCGEGQVCALIDNGFLQNPFDKFSVIDLNGGYIVKLDSFYCNGPFKIILQKKFPNALFTLFYENGYKLSIETAFGVFPFNFNEKILSADVFISSVSFSEVYVLTLSTPKGKRLLVFKADSSLQTVLTLFNDEITDYSFENDFTTTKYFFDIAKHKVKYFWKTENEKLVCYKKEVSVFENFNKNNLINEVLPYAFLEGMRLGENISDYLSDDIMENSAYLKDFFGDYIGVFPPPPFRNFDNVGLLYKKTENLFFSKYYSFNVFNRKICGINKLD